MRRIGVSRSGLSKTLPIKHWAYHSTVLFLSLALQASTFAASPHGLTWQGAVVFAGQLDGGEVLQHEEAASALFLGYPHGPKTAEFVPADRTKETFTFRAELIGGTVRASADSFICSNDPRQPLGSSFGRAEIEGANSVYDRTDDWLITFRGDPTITPLKPGGYQVMGATSVEFRPHYYRDHLGYFLWTKGKPLWPKPVGGWCSWAAHGQEIKERDVLDAAFFFSQNLKDYGYNVVQIDDGYQRVLQFGQDAKGHEPFSHYWTQPNEKFPRGMGPVAQDIKAQGLTPGIWVGYYLPLGLQHREGYIADVNGQPHKGPWVNYAMNGLDRAAIDEGYIDTIREFKRQGWDYFKIDTLRHILYDNYRQVPAYWAARNESMETAYRAILTATKKAAGSSYVLACWGTLPELAGLVDGARIGEDVGPDFDSMRRSAKYIAQFHHLNDVVWRNDPDYMCLRVPVAQARTWSSLTSLAGGHVMVSDPVGDYDAERVDILRRVGPPLVTKPSSVVAHAPDPEFLTFSAEKGGEQWKVMARFAWGRLPATEIKLDPAKKWLAFDFWDEKFLGASPNFHALAQGECQVVSVREDLGRPQVLGTNRHIGQGAYELAHVRWNGHKLSGAFLRGRGRQWSLYVHVPKGWRFVDASSAATVEGEVVKITFPEGPGAIAWSANFARD